MDRIQTGRNLPAATVIGLLLLSSVIASLFVYKYVFILLALVALLLAAHELTTQWSRSRDVKTSFFLIATSISLMVFSSVYFGILGLIGAYLVAGILNALYGLTNRFSFRKIFKISIFTYSYLGLFGSLSMLMLKTEDGAGRVFLFIAITAFSDTGGYLTGILIGKHKIAPSISPQKSYEGLIGSIIFAVLFAGFAGPKFLEIEIWQAVVIGITLAIAGTAGDLFESGIKRQLGIKDFSTLIPGHGGMLDRLDSLAPNALMSFLSFGLFLGFN